MAVISIVGKRIKPLANRVSIFAVPPKGRAYSRLLHYGLAFVFPSFFMVVVIGIAYRMFGGLPWMEAIFYRVGAAVVGIIAISSYKLTEKSISKINIKSITEKWMLWIFFLLAAIIRIV